MNLESWLKRFQTQVLGRGGVKEYAYELLDNLEEKAQSYERLPKNGRELEEWILNGAVSWDDYSYGGC